MKKIIVLSVLVGSLAGVCLAQSNTGTTYGNDKNSSNAMTNNAATNSINSTTNP